MSKLQFPIFFPPKVHNTTGIFSKEKYSSMTFACVATSTVAVMCKKDHIHSFMGADYKNKTHKPFEQKACNFKKKPTKSDRYFHLCVPFLLNNLEQLQLRKPYSHLLITKNPLLFLMPTSRKMTRHLSISIAFVYLKKKITLRKCGMWW